MTDDVRTTPQGRSRAETPVRRALEWTRSTPWPLIGAFIAIGTILRIPQLNNSLNEAYSFRQTQTAMTAREFARNGIDLLTSPLPVFGPHSDVPMEMPLFQALVALVHNAGVGLDEAGRILSLIFFQVSAVLLAILIKRYFGTPTAIVATVLFQFVPFTVQWGAAHLMEFFAVALALLMVLGVDDWLRRGSIPWLVVGGLAGVGAFLVKSTTAPLWCLFLIVPGILALRELGTRRGLMRGAIGVAGIVPGLVAAALWTKHADAVKEAQPLTPFVTSTALREWNFGTLQDRLDPGKWATIFDRIATTITGPIAIVIAVAIIGAVLRGSLRERLALSGLALVAFAGPFVFFNLYWVHSYYLSAVVAALVAITAYAITSIASLLSSAPARRIALTIGGVAVLLVSVYLTPAAGDIIRTFLKSQPLPPLALALQAETSPDDLIVAVGCDWGPQIFYYADRKGVMFRADADWQWFWSVNDINDYPYLATCDVSADATAFLPAGTRLIPVTDTIFRIDPPAS